MKLSHWLSLISFIIACFLIWSLKEAIIQIFAAIIIAMALCTIVGKVQSIFHLNRSISLIITMLGVSLIITIAFLLIIPQFTQEFKILIIQIPSAAKELFDLIINKSNDINLILSNNENTISLNKNILNNNLYPVTDGAGLATAVTESLSKILNLASNLGIGIVQLIFVISVSLMITVQPDAYREVAIILTPSFYRRRARKILLICGEALSNWMFGVLLSSSCVAIMAGLALYLLGVKLVVANALIAGALNLIPNVGPTISTIFPMSVAFLDNPWKSIAVLGAYIIIQNLESYIITPSIMQQKVKLLPGLTITAQFLFTVIFGPIGLILALPLAVVLQVLIKEILVKDILEEKFSRSI